MSKSNKQKETDTTKPDSNPIHALIKTMRYIPRQGDYYTLTLSTDEKGNFINSCYSHCIGYTDDSPRREIRAPSLVDPKKMIDLWEGAGFSWLVCDTAEQLHLYIHLGGNALIKKELAEKHLSHFYKPMHCAYRGPISAPAVSSGIPKEETQRAPTPKMRARILSRDGDRCMKCGNRPFDNPHVQLEVHHVKPWALGGLTVPPNLITLCHTCHKGIEPHFDMNLYGYVRLEKDPVKSLLEKQNYEQTRGILEYRKKMFRVASKAKSQKTVKGIKRGARRSENIDMP